MKGWIYLTGLLMLGGCEIYWVESPAPGYDARAAFAGYYEVEEYSYTTGQYFVYDLQIDLDCCDSQRIWLRGLYGYDRPVYALVRNGRLVIPRQQQGGYEWEGSGRWTDTGLQFNYVVRSLYAWPVFSDILQAEAWAY